MTIRIQPAAVRRIGQRLRILFADAHRDATDRLRGILSALSRSWSSEAQASFEAGFGGWLASFGQRGQDLLRDAAFLDRAADDYEALEALLVDEVADPPTHAGKHLARPMPQGSGPSLNGPVSTTGGSLASQTFNGTASAGKPLGLTNVRLTYRADYAIDYYSDRVVVRLTQYPSTNEVASPTHWSSAATVITRSGRQLQYNIDALDPNTIARAEGATLTLPLDPTDPPVRVDLYIINVADGPAGAAASRQFYGSFDLDVPPAPSTPTVVAPLAPTATPNPIPGLGGPRPIQGSATPTPAPRPTPVPAQPTPPRRVGPIRAD